MVYARNPEVLWRSTSRGPVLLAPGHRSPERLGGVAAVVWEVLDDPLTAVAVEQAVAELVEPGGEVQHALEQLVRLELVVASR